MDLFIICFSLAALLYVLTLPFIGKRARKKESADIQNVFRGKKIKSHTIACTVCQMTRFKEDDND